MPDSDRTEGEEFAPRLPEGDGADAGAPSPDPAGGDGAEEDGASYTALVERLNTELAEAKAQLEKYQAKEYNFAALRKGKESADTKLQALEEKFEEKLDAVRASVSAESLRLELLKHANGDADIAGKALAHYHAFRGSPKDDAEKQARIRSAMLLATDGAYASRNALSRSAGTGGGRAPSAPGGRKLSEDAIDVAKKFGLSTEDLKKAGKL